MGKTIDVSKVNLSPKGIALLIAGLVIVIVCWKIAEWGLGKVSGTTSAITSPFKTV